MLINKNLSIVNKETGDRILMLVSKKLAKEADTKELLELEQLLDENPEKTPVIKQLVYWWADDNREKADDDSFFLFKKVLKRIGK